MSFEYRKMESRRQLQVGKLIQQALSEVLRKDGFSMYGKAMVTVSQVRLSPDLSIARTYLSIFNAEDNEQVMSSIQANTHTLRRLLGARIRNKVRMIPELLFFIDDTLDEVFKMDELFQKLDKERKNDPPKIEEDSNTEETTNEGETE